jgi:hypothetical protein
MDFDVLSGPPLAELARTTMASVSAAVVTCAGSPALLPSTVPVRAGRTGAPILLPRPGSSLAGHLASSPALVTVAVPAEAPFSALRLTGMTRPGLTRPGLTRPVLTRAGAPRGDGAAGPAPDSGAGEPAAYPVTLQSLEFTGAGAAPVALAQYEAAAPDPFRLEAPAILRHLEHSHMAELVGCVRAHSITDAEYVIPQRLDRFGLELLVLASSGLAAVRLAFADGPVTTIADVPLSIRALLTCRCTTGPSSS